MKLILVLLITLPTLLLQVEPKPTFEEGWRKGYVYGWCLNDPACLEPLCPLAPLPFAGQDSYQFGFARGVIRGQADRKTQDSTYINHIKKQ